MVQSRLVIVVDEIHGNIYIDYDYDDDFLIIRNNLGDDIEIFLHHIDGLISGLQKIKNRTCDENIHPTAK